MPDRFHVQPLTPERFDDFAEVLGPSGISGCWCMYWVWPTVREWGEHTAGGGRAENRAAFQALVQAGPPPGLVGYDDHIPVAWCRVVPRERLPALDRSQAFRTDLDTTGVWSLSCFKVRPSQRGHGWVERLTVAAVAMAREQGALFVEVYPTDVDRQLSPSSLWRGVASTFTRLGFEEVQRRRSDRPMMRLALT